MNPEVTKDFQKQEIDGIEYLWIKTGQYEGNGVKRALTMERFVRKLKTHAKKLSTEYKPDVVIASSTYPLDAYAAKKIARISGAKYIHEVHDMWPSTLYEVGGMSKHHPFVAVMQIAENYAYKHCDKCVSLLPYAKEYMVEHGLQSDRFINIQNGIVEEDWEECDEIPNEHKAFFEQHKGQFIVGYFGGHAFTNALDQLLDIAQLYSERYGNLETVFVLVGEGLEKERLIQRKEREKIDNLFFLPAVRKRSVPSLLEYFDCAYITGISSPLYRFGLSLNKMYDAMMASLPIICAFDASETLVKTYDCGLQCSPKDTEEIINYIDVLRNMPEEDRRAIGRRGREAVLNDFTYKKLAGKFAVLFE